MASFIFELSQALARAVAVRIRNDSDRALARGELMALATVFEILGQSPDQLRADEKAAGESWEGMERMAKRDLELVNRARSTASLGRTSG